MPDATASTEQAAPTGRPTLGATALGYPRIGRDRELKRSLEAYWRGRASDADVIETRAAVRRDGWDAMTGAGLDSVPVGISSLYDQVLDAAVLLGAVPERFRALPAGTPRERLDRYSAMARGTGELSPLEMTKWFDTNYHYLVPEIDPDQSFVLDAGDLLDEVAQAREAGVPARPVVVGPVSFLLLAKPAPGSPETFRPLDRLDDVVAQYVDLLGQLAAAGVEWVQLDEPALVSDRSPDEVAAVARTYRALAAVVTRPAVLVATYFGPPTEALPTLAGSGVEGVAVDLVSAPGLGEQLRDLTAARDLTVVAGLVDGRNVWRTDLEAALATAESLRGAVGALAVGTSCSLLHLPYDVSVETGLPDRVRARLAFADQRLAEVAVLARGLADGRDAVAAELAAAAEAVAIPAARDEGVRARLAAMRPEEARREAYEERLAAQDAWLDLPPLPTTTIGSFPQTPEIRTARARLRSGELDEAGYVAAMRDEIARVVALQERLGLDVLVHGEPERNDMVQYFAEQLDGYASTAHGWVQSYGTRCVRPPVLHGDVSRPAPMTVEWARYAQSLTERPLKGMLTGPVTMLAWSFVRVDQPLADTARQVALAIRDEVHDLEAVGVRVIQVDEPALRELLPLRAVDQSAYREWSVAAFRLATSGVSPATQVHTHLCYSEFDEIVDAIDGLDADVTSIEAARSRMEIVGALAEKGYRRGVGPGVYDIHSPRVPSADELTELLRLAVSGIGPGRLWVNPDCGLKTRRYDEVEPALSHLVEATRRVRAELPA